VLETCLLPQNHQIKKRCKHDDYAKFTGERNVLGVKELPSKRSGKPNEQKSLSAEKKAANEREAFEFPGKRQRRDRYESSIKVTSKHC
jgi:hypothetical protein